ncbi:MAG: DUF3575 domain-containing protein [Tannerellaceae bacterium]|nr:DUF3575 domain-containing protein [Tannerellaceae bacterium]
MNKIWLGLLFGFCMSIAAHAQRIAVKSNVVYDAAAILNVGGEFIINKQFSVDLSGNYMGWELGDRVWKHWMVQPEGRYWLLEGFNGHFFGVHGMYLDYDVSRLEVPFVNFSRRNHYKGTAYGGGVSYGYSLYATPRLNIEFSAGVGYLNFDYDKTYIREDRYDGRFKKSYFGPTKLGVSVVYIIN